jgi:hypothetical protein
MAVEVFASFRYEYVSGSMAVLSASEGDIETGSAVRSYVTNRAGGEGVARIILNVQSLENAPAFDSGQVTVGPGQMWSGDFFPDNEHLGLYCARIFTTSLNLVPSLRISNPPPSDVPGGSFPDDVYFAPGDFAVFTLPFIPFPIPPIGPGKP